ncbi:MAG: TonB-dependent receptor [Cyclobacteriaceae bacterium]
MDKKFTHQRNLMLIILLFPMTLFSQEVIRGKVTDQADSSPLIGANVVIKGTTSGASTGLEGGFTLNVTSLPVVLRISFVGYETEEVEVTSSEEVLDIKMMEGLRLNELVVTGNRTRPRTMLDSPVPIDNIGAADLRASGQTTIERMLTFKVPSFNAQNQAISDATAHYDPADLRGLGPSRTLVLVNGKRKNQSAQVYLNRTPGKGEVGIDLKSIPTAAIDRVEVLRDGASAQYGSDAIAGVINMVLKKNTEYSTLSTNTGITSQGDGFNFATDFNTGLNFGDGGSINLTLSYYNQKLTNRAGTPGVADLPAAPNVADYSGGASDPEYISDAAIYDTWEQWAIDNPDLGMHVGQPDMEQKDLFVNIAHPIGENSEFYTFHGVTKRTGRSFAYYRAPYWRQDPVGDMKFLTDSASFLGYQPTFEVDISDHINAMGMNFGMGSNWNGDASVTYGSNSVFYTVNNSVNRDYLRDHGTSPRTFHPGGYSLSNVIGNLDFSGVLSDQLGVAVGFEMKKEYFKSFEGDPLSYYAGGSDSFAGIKPDEVVDESRTNVAIYGQLDYDLSDDLLLAAAGRFEDFSDFGSNFSWKMSGRYRLNEDGVVRGSFSTGFRAPTLHQRYLTNSQYIIVAGSSEPLLQGTLANDNSAVVALGVPNLFAETSTNVSAGITYKLSDNFSASIDLYQINVDDRVLFSSQIGTLDGNLDGSDAVETILIDNNVVAVQFFINAGNTSTKGADIVLNYDSFDKFSAMLAANFNSTEIDAITTPSALETGGYNIFDRQEQGLITNSRPKSKIILGLTYEIDKWTIGFNNTRFGKVTITAPESGGEDQELSAKVVTDFSLDYELSENFNLSTIINNIFDVYPDVTKTSTNTAQAGSRFVYSSEVQQMGQLGTAFRIGFNYKF